MAEEKYEAQSFLVLLAADGCGEVRFRQQVKARIV